MLPPRPFGSPSTRVGDDTALDRVEAQEHGPPVAAALRQLSPTLAGVIQKPTRVDGQRALEVIFPDDHFPERIWLDAATGVPIQEKDGATSATVFAVERVVAAHLPLQLSPASRLR
jgi:hypothetical protein